MLNQQDSRQQAKDSVAQMVAGLAGMVKAVTNLPLEKMKNMTPEEKAAHAKMIQDSGLTNHLADFSKTFKELSDFAKTL